MLFQIVPIAEASGVVGLMNSINKVIINPLIVLMFALAIVYFVYGLVQYLLTPDNEETKKTSKKHMLWGIFGMFIMVAVFGILNLIMTTLGTRGIKIDSSGYKVENLQ